jgi:hypothetical protein
MANTVASTFRVNGSRLFVLEVQITGDGSGEETATELIDPADLTGAPSSFKIRAVQWSLDGFSASLLWDATASDHALTLSTVSDILRFSDTGSHIVNPLSTGATGKLLITTVGLGAGDTGTIIIEGQHS